MNEIICFFKIKQIFRPKYNKKRNKKNRTDPFNTAWLHVYRQSLVFAISRKAQKDRFWCRPKLHGRQITWFTKLLRCHLLFLHNVFLFSAACRCVRLSLRERFQMHQFFSSFEKRNASCIDIRVPVIYRAILFILKAIYIRDPGAPTPGMWVFFSFSCTGQCI